MERQVIKISENTYSIEEEYVRWFLLIGEDKAAVIDSGIIGSGIKQTAQSLTDKPLILINTHGDRDHSAGNSEFDSFYIMEADYINRDFASVHPDSKPVFMEDGQIIDLGNRPLEIITAEGHTKGSVAILDINNRALIAGDTVQNGIIYMFGKHRNPDAYESSLNKIIDREIDFDIIYASHGTVNLEKTYTRKVLEDWGDVNRGVYPFEEVFLHGTNVKCYKAKNCGFYKE